MQTAHSVEQTAEIRSEKLLEKESDVRTNAFELLSKSQERHIPALWR